ncbi:FecR family protein [Pusillimonas caeni]|uniref:FecR family protein n=1 Tax=Pusillimonas caeni TaxID=1348472 RepID=UPI000E59D38A|nr:FecR family protein [Pusillimonas caeni]TFL11517.1 FecR family protein [Pusillimonas caeni]
MKPPNASSNSGDPRDLAASWFAHLHSGDATQEDRRVFEQWRNAHPENDRQYRNVQQFWDATLQVPENELREILARREAAAPRAHLARRRFGLGLAGVCSAALVGGVALQGGWLASPLQTIQIASPRGERRQMVLPDGSVLDINTGTRAVARLYEGKRRVELLEGEIFFTVQRDERRPFVVDAGESQIVVTGTRFNVRYDALAAQVSVESGSVEVSKGPWWNRHTRSLAKGQGVDVLQEQGLGEVRHRDIETILAWQRGKIVFEDMPLAHAVAEINRYLEQPARLDAPALRQHRIAGIFSVDDPQALIDMLPEFAPVRVYRLQDGQARIVAK